MTTSKPFVRPNYSFETWKVEDAFARMARAPTIESRLIWLRRYVQARRERIEKRAQMN